MSDANATVSRTANQGSNEPSCASHILGAASPQTGGAVATDVEYAERIRREIETYRHVENVSNLPEIHGYWAHNYVLPLLEPFGIRNEVEFYLQYVAKYLANSEGGPATVVTLGAGNCQLEVDLAKGLLAAGMTGFTIECVDINTNMLERGRALAAEQGVSEYLRFTEADANKWSPNRQQYGVVIANHALHHFVALEYLFDSIRSCLVPAGYFLTHDMIGRNGHMRWPEALEIVQRFWAELPERYKYNRLLKRHEPDYINFDCSDEGFEGIRAQDILPLLIEKFQFELFVPFGNVIDIFVDRCFGHNYDSTNDWDRAFIDRVQAADQSAINAGIVKPTHMYAALTVRPPKELFVHGHLTPEFCVRRPG